MPYSDLFQEWRVADQNAHALEQEILLSFMEAINGKAPLPSNEIREKAHRMRAVANDLFQASMDEFRRMALEAKRPPTAAKDFPPGETGHP